MSGTTGEHYTQELKELKNVNKDIYSSENQENSSSPHVNNFELTNTQDLLQQYGVPDNKLGAQDRMDLYRLHKQVGDKYLIRFIDRAKRKNKPTANYVLGILRNETKNGELTFDDFEKNIPKQNKQGNDPTRKLRELTEEDVMGGM